MRRVTTNQSVKKTDKNGIHRRFSSRAKIYIASKRQRSVIHPSFTKSTTPKMLLSHGGDE